MSRTDALTHLGEIDEGYLSNSFLDDRFHSKHLLSDRWQLHPSARRLLTVKVTSFSGANYANVNCLWQPRPPPGSPSAVLFSTQFKGPFIRSDFLVVDLCERPVTLQNLRHICTPLRALPSASARSGLRVRARHQLPHHSHHSSTGVWMIPNTVLIIQWIETLRCKKKQAVKKDDQNVTEVKVESIKSKTTHCAVSTYSTWLNWCMNQKVTFCLRSYVGYFSNLHTKQSLKLKEQY